MRDSERWGGRGGADLVRRVEEGCPASVILPVQTEQVRKLEEGGGGRRCSRMGGQGSEARAGLTAWCWSRGSSPPPRPEALPERGQSRTLAPAFRAMNCAGVWGAPASPPRPDLVFQRIFAPSACLFGARYIVGTRFLDDVASGTFPNRLSPSSGSQTVSKLLLCTGRELTVP